MSETHFLAELYPTSCVFYNASTDEVMVFSGFEARLAKFIMRYHSEVIHTPCHIVDLGEL
jgi:hypothetical protein